jgi:hypothetical protein
MSQTLTTSAFVFPRTFSPANEESLGQLLRKGWPSHNRLLVRYTVGENELGQAQASLKSTIENLERGRVHYLLHIQTDKDVYLPCLNHPKVTPNKPFPLGLVEDWEIELDASETLSPCAIADIALHIEKNKKTG